MLVERCCISQGEISPNGLKNVVGFTLAMNKSMVVIQQNRAMYCAIIEEKRYALGIFLGLVIKQVGGRSYITKEDSISSARREPCKSKTCLCREGRYEKT